MIHIACDCRRSTYSRQVAHRQLLVLSPSFLLSVHIAHNVLFLAVHIACNPQLGVGESGLSVQVPAQQRSEGGVPCPRVSQAGARETASSAAREEPTEATQSAGVPPKSPLATRSPGLCLIIAQRSA